jgi:hypothetical protein
MATIEASHRLYHCLCCGVQVLICRGCDRGNVYCEGRCAAVRRREGLRRAGERYQNSFRGAVRHAARQRTWRRRRAEKVTHQGSAATGGAATVTTPAADLVVDDADPAERYVVPLVRHSRPAISRAPALRCCFCGRRLGAFTGLGPLRGGP